MPSVLTKRVMVALLCLERREEKRQSMPSGVDGKVIVTPHRLPKPPHNRMVASHDKSDKECSVEVLVGKDGKDI